MAQYHKAIPVSLELTARGRILKFKEYLLLIQSLGAESQVGVEQGEGKQN